MALIPRPYNVAANIAHLERVRPLSTAISISLDKAAKSEANLATPMGSGPKGNPSILRRIGIKKSAPHLKIKAPKLHPLRVK